MNVTLNVSAELEAFAKSRNQTVKNLLNEAITVLEDLAKEPPGTVLAYCHQPTGHITIVRTGAPNQKPATTRPKLTVVPKSED